MNITTFIEETNINVPQNNSSAFTYFLKQHTSALTSTVQIKTLIN